MNGWDAMHVSELGMRGGDNPDILLRKPVEL